jgi:molybdopterin-guanine dinucleotide biosynthesis protein B
MIHTDGASVPVVCVIARCSNSGKTLLMEALVAALKARGRRVAAVKHCPHGHQIGHSGKDSQRILNAGADAVVMNSPDKVTTIRRVDAEWPLDELLEFLGSGYDIVLVEGYKASSAAKILVVPGGDTEPDDADLTRLLATVVSEAGPDGAPRFPADLINGLVELLERAAADGRASYTDGAALETS